MKALIHVSSLAFKGIILTGNTENMGVVEAFVVRSHLNYFMKCLDCSFTLGCR